MLIPGRVVRVLAGAALSLCLVLIIVRSGWAETDSIAPAQGVTVLLYHRFGDPRYPTTNVSVGALSGQMEYLKSGGFRVLHPREFEEIMDGKRPAGPRDVLLTVDDGYRSFAEHGFPVFRSFGFPVVVFISTESIEDRYGDMLAWEDIAALREEGVWFANHSHSHPHTGMRQTGETIPTYEERLRSDTLKAREHLRARGIENQWYAFPYGEWTPDLAALMASLGYRFLFSQDPGVALPGGPPGLPIPRMAIVGRNMPLAEFAGHLSRLPLEATLVEPSPGWVGSRIPAIRVTMPGLADWGTGEVNLFLSEKGRLEPAVDTIAGTVTVDTAQEINRPLNRIIVTARDRTGRYRMRSWLLLKPQEQAPTGQAPGMDQER